MGLLGSFQLLQSGERNGWMAPIVQLPFHWEDNLEYALLPQIQNNSCGASQKSGWVVEDKVQYLDIWGRTVNS